MTGDWQKMRRVLGVVAVLGLMGACSGLERFHGFVPPEEELAQLQVGATSKDEVIALFGPPTADRGLLNNTIYYAASQVRTVGPFAPEVVEREIIAIDFTADDRVRNISRYGLDDGRVVVLDRRVTEDGINDVTFLSQLFGAFGRLDAGQFLGDGGGQPDTL